MKFNKKANLIKLIHVGKTKLGLDDDVYRDIIQSTTGKTSSKDLNLAQLQAVLDRFKQFGFEVESKNKTDVKNLANDAQSKLIRHLWLQLHAAGQVRNGSELALAKFVENKVGVSALQFLSSHHADMIINHLRQWCKRCGIERIHPVEA
ncbi:regulatory protein GemA [Acinetobacter sp. V91_7]|uniref:gp16 family protein n=1 Tax=unclassified Acinetobacter TaxID=196816 RepID=UPI00287EFFBA|nr:MULTISPECIES: regulatory protein GemA [unclassified Acinetobacter]MDS7933998.1 regulatory protein GemA [Acinetobacter sp. V91_4B]MDS7962666.1 regulatory protein GemA [Acinetobacter sp. V91_7]MDS8029431.1 regulatory protein GemA [Acinetobacter sp. V91_13]